MPYPTPWPLDSTSYLPTSFTSLPPILCPLYPPIVSYVAKYLISDISISYLLYIVSYIAKYLLAEGDGSSCGLFSGGGMSCQASPRAGVSAVGCLTRRGAHS